MFVGLNLSPKFVDEESVSEACGCASGVLTFLEHVELYEDGHFGLVELVPRKFVGALQRHEKQVHHLPEASENYAC